MRTGTTGNTKVQLVAAIANKAAPTTAELAAGVDVSGFMLRNGLQTPRAGQNVDISDALDRQNKSAPGTKGGDTLTFRGHHDPTGTNTAWTSFAEDTQTHLVVRRGTLATVAWAATNKVEVYPIRVNSRQPDDIGDNVATTFTASCNVFDAADLNSVVA